MDYPKYLYHSSKGSALVNNLEEEKALGPGWTSVPGGKAPVAVPAPAKAPVPAPAAPKPPAPVAPKPVVPTPVAPVKPKP